MNRALIVASEVHMAKNSEAVFHDAFLSVAKVFFNVS